MALTDKERAMLTALRDSDYHDGADPIGNTVWVEDVCAPFGASAGGIMASLQRNGYAITCGTLVELTQAGADALRAYVPPEDPPTVSLCRACGLIVRPDDDGHGSWCPACGDPVTSVVVVDPTYAAAPAMLKALTNLRRKVAAHTNRATADTFREVLDESRAAIARAEGRTA